jgi:hypothetical protein
MRSSNKWISVDTYLPPLGTPVLIFFADTIGIAHLRTDDGITDRFHDGEGAISGVSHWAELPKKPNS